MSDLQVGADWGTVTILLFFACWRLAAWMRPRDDLYQKALHTLILCWALLAATTISLGSIHLLTGPLLLSAVALSCLVLFVVPRFRSQIPQQAKAGTTGVPGAVSLEATWGTPAEVGEAFLWLFLVSFWASHVVWNGLLQFPNDFDSLMYHLPLIDHWLQAHSLYAPDSWQWSTPGNNEVIGLWCAAPFSGDFLVPLSNGLAALILALASRELASLLGLGHLTASICGVAVMANYVVLKQLVDTENDVAVAALTAASAAYALRYARSGGLADVVLGGLSLGLLAGIKYYALGYAALAWLVLLGATMFSRGFRTGAKAGLLSASIAVGLGGYWYIRNWVLTGSPLYPKYLFSAHDELALYYPGDVWRSSFVGNGSQELFPLAVEAIRKMAGPLPLAAFYALPGVIAWLSVSGLFLWRKPSSRFPGIARILLGGLVVGAGLVLVSTPFAVEDIPGTLNHLKWAYTPVRYGMSFLSLIIIIFSVFLLDMVRILAFALRSWRMHTPFLSSLGERWYSLGRWQAIIGWCLLATPGLLFLGLSVYQVTSFAPKFKGGLTEPALCAADGAGLGMIALLFCGVVVWRHRLLLSMIGAVFLVSAIVGADMLSKRWHAGFAAFYDRMFERGVFTALAAPKRPLEKICVLDFRPYPFFGSRRQHYVCQPHRPASASAFYDYLHQRNVTLIAARFDFDLRSRGWELCRSYLIQNPDLYVSAKDPPWPYTLFRVRSSLPIPPTSAGELRVPSQK